MPAALWVLLLLFMEWGVFGVRGTLAGAWVQEDWWRPVGHWRVSPAPLPPGDACAAVATRGGQEIISPDDVSVVSVPTQDQQAGSLGAPPRPQGSMRSPNCESKFVLQSGLQPGGWGAESRGAFHTFARAPVPVPQQSRTGSPHS